MQSTVPVRSARTVPVRSAGWPETSGLGQPASSSGCLLSEQHTSGQTPAADVAHLDHSQPQYNLFESRAAGKPLGRNRRTMRRCSGDNGALRASPPPRADTKPPRKLAPSLYGAALESATYFTSGNCLPSLYDRSFNSHSLCQVKRRQIDSITVWLAFCFNSSSETHKARWDHPPGTACAVPTGHGAQCRPARGARSADRACAARPSAPAGGCRWHTRLHPANRGLL